MTTGGTTIASRRRLLICLAVVIVTGLGSRMIHSGIELVDKYLGDGLYAVMVYLILGLVRGGDTPLRRAVSSMVIMTLLETFQLTSIPLEMTRSSHIVPRIAGRLIGTTFSWLDLSAYTVGVAGVVPVDLYWLSNQGRKPRVSHETD